MFETKEKQVTGIIFILDITEKSSKKGEPFLIIRARDNQKQEAILKRWQCSEYEFPVTKGELAFCTIQINSYKGEKQFIIRSVKPAYDGVHADLVDYMNVAPYKASDMYHYILDFTEREIKNDSYKSIIKNIYSEYKEKLMIWSAGRSIHHNCVSGLLYHIYSMLHAAESYVKIYSFLHKDLLFAGVILHDIGKLIELDTNALGESEYSIEGNLTGHLYIGADLITKYKPQDMDQEDFLLLKHMVLSHHGKPEYGAVTTPKIPEAFALYYIDDMDTKMYQCEHFIHEIHPGTFFDLDAAAFLLGVNGKVRSDCDFIFYNNKIGPGIKHTGDNRTGEGEGDDEQIIIDLTAIPKDVDKIAFTVTIDQAESRRQNFGQVDNSYIHILDSETNKELLKYDLGEDYSIETALVVGELYKLNGEWKFNAIGSGFQGGLAALCNHFGIEVE